MKRTAIIMLMLTALAGCETVNGMGQDIENGGEAIQQSSNDVQSEL